jgi:glycosyltransferase involved in cell wall biosynthesis
VSAGWNSRKIPSKIREYLVFCSYARSGFLFSFECSKQMKIAYYMPFKPMGHHNPSGDLIIGTELFEHLQRRNHAIQLISRLRCRWIFYRPLTLLRLAMEKRRVQKHCQEWRPDLWLSYHSYYKAPDLLGSFCSQKLGIPYVIFQGIYSTKRRKQLPTLPGFLLNKKVLLSAHLVVTNKKHDYANLQRLLPETRLSYVAPGIHPRFFTSSPDWREKLHKQWRVGEETVVMTAAMMRPGVKTAGLTQVIESCATLVKSGLGIRLIIAGDGTCRQQLKKRADELLAGKVLFLGKIPRLELYRYYSAADIFVFPGIEEALGMVYLEAQSCHLPVVAFQDWGGREAVVHEQTGLLSPSAQPEKFTANIRMLVENADLRQSLAVAAGKHVRQNHDLDINYAHLEGKLFELSERPLPPKPSQF